MTHYEQRLERDLARIREAVTAQGAAVDDSLARATKAFLDQDRAEAANICLRDNPINRRMREIDRLCHAFVARHLPSARHLRFVSAVMRMNIELERIGDYAVTISRETAQATEGPPETIRRDLEMMCEQGRQLLENAVVAFTDGNAERARETMIQAGRRGRVFHRVFQDLLEVGEENSMSTEDLFGMLVVLYRLERVADQAKNVCEAVLFLETGETKPAKRYSILFLDRTNDGASQMAEAVGRKAFPESGSFESAGWEPAEALDPAVRTFLDAQGYDLRAARPRLLDASHDPLSEHHVIVALEDGALAQIPDLPFHTVFLEWPIPSTAAEPEAAHRALLERIQELMELLRGEGAA